MHGQVQRMFDAGVIKQSDDGVFHPVVDPLEVESIKSARGIASRRHPINEDDIDRINADLDAMEQDDDHL